MAGDLAELIVADARAWRRWLEHQQATAPGVWLVLAKKGTNKPTSLSYEQALQEALACGWVDGQLGRRDEATFRRKFTPRARRSTWSQRNVELVEALTREGRMHPAGLAAVAWAKADGSWQSAYSGQRAIEVPPDLAAALRAAPRAETMFQQLSRANRYAVLYRVGSVKRPATRARRIEEFVAMLERGETLHPR